MPKIDVYECEDCGEFEFVDYVGAPPKCPGCGKVMKYVTTYTEPED